MDRILAILRRFARDVARPAARRAERDAELWDAFSQARKDSDAFGLEVGDAGSITIENCRFIPGQGD